MRQDFATRHTILRWGFIYVILVLLLIDHSSVVKPVSGQLDALGAVLSVVPVTSILATAGVVGVKLAALSRLLQALGYDQAYLANGGSGTAAEPIGLQTKYAYMFPYVPGLNISVKGEMGTPYQNVAAQQREASEHHTTRKTYPAMALPGDYENQKRPFRGIDTLKEIFHNAGIKVLFPNRQQQQQFPQQGKPPAQLEYQSFDSSNMQATTPMYNTQNQPQPNAQPDVIPLPPPSSSSASLLPNTNNNNNNNNADQSWPNSAPNLNNQQPLSSRFQAPDQSSPQLPLVPQSQPGQDQPMQPQPLPLQPQQQPQLQQQDPHQQQQQPPQQHHQFHIPQTQSFQHRVQSSQVNMPQPHHNNSPNLQENRPTPSLPADQVASSPHPLPTSTSTLPHQTPPPPPTSAPSVPAPVRAPQPVAPNRAGDEVQSPPVHFERERPPHFGNYHPIPQHEYFYREFMDRQNRLQLEAAEQLQRNRDKHFASGQVATGPEQPMFRPFFDLDFEPMAPANGPLVREPIRHHQNNSHSLQTGTINSSNSAQIPTSFEPFSSNLRPLSFVPDGPPPFNDEINQNEFNLIFNRRRRRKRDLPGESAEILSLAEKIRAATRKRNAASVSSRFGMPATNIGSSMRKRRSLSSKIMLASSGGNGSS